MLLDSPLRTGLCLVGLLAVSPFSLHSAVLVDEQASWSFWKGTSAPSSPDPTAWRSPTFNAGSWPVANAPFFYEDSSGFTGNTDLTDMRGSYSSIFLRRTLHLSSAPPAVISLDAWSDDGCIVWINGIEVLRVNVPDGEIPYDGTSLSALGEPNVSGIKITNADSILTTGDNVVAVQALNSSVAESSDFLIAIALSTDADLVPPEIAVTVPEENARVRSLSQIQVTFTESVQGVDAADLLVNNVPATSLTVYSPRDYLFSFAAVPTGTAQFTWRTTHGITDLGLPPNPFSGGSWQIVVDPTAPLAVVRINEFLADNEHGIRDDDGEHSDWIECFNPGNEPVSLAGWSLTDNASDLTQWHFPPVIIGARSYLVVWASGKDRTNNTSALHTSFRLSNGGEYLGLADPQTNIVSEYRPFYPPQQSDISYGLDATDSSIKGYFPTPTPGAANAPGGPGFAPTPVFSLPGGVYTNSILSVTLSTPTGVIRYTTDGSTPTAGSPVYSSPLQLSSSALVQARVFQTGLLPGTIVAQHYVLAASSAANFSSNLPLLIINTSGNWIPQDYRIPAAVTAIETVRGRAYLRGTPDFQGKAQIEVRGQTSAGFPKQPYNLELNDTYDNDLEVPLLGLPAESDWVLNNPYSDKSLLNNYLAFSLHEAMGHYAVRRRFVEVFVDTNGGRLEYPNDYAGIYVLLEKIKVDNHRVDLARLTPEMNSEPEISGGYIVKKDKWSPTDVLFYTQGGADFGGQELRMHEPKPAEVTSAQLDWIRNYLNQFESALFAPNWLTATGTNHYSNYIDVDSFVDAHWIVEFTKQIDGYRLSNYLSKDRGGKLRMEPIWDWNLSFGNADYLTGEYTTGWYWTQIGGDDHLYLRRLITGNAGTSGTGDPDFLQRIADRWSVLRTNVLASSNVVARVDQIATLLSEAQAREFQRWPRLGTYVWPNPQIYVTPTTYAGIIAAKKSWIQGRFAWIDLQYPQPPTFGSLDTYVTPGYRLTLTQPEPTLYFTTNGSDPRAPSGAVSAQASTYSSPLLVNSNLQAVARILRAGRNPGWGGASVATLITTPSPLRISELMFRPAEPPAGNTNATESEEFIELLNPGPNPISLQGYQLSDGASFSFATGVVSTLNPGSRLVVVRSLAAFTNRYGTQLPVAGQYQGALDNAGERITLTGPLGEHVHSVRYDPSWYPGTDGLGFSLVPSVESTNPLVDWDSASAWRHSRTVGGSPGQPDSQPDPIPGVLVSEVLTHTDLPDVDFIELFNPTAAQVDVSGWYLSDDPRTPKFRIPAGTRINSNGYVVFTQSDFAANPDDPSSFDLRSAGDEVYLFSATASGVLTGYRHGFSLGAALNGVSFGRLVNSEGRELMVAQSTPTPGTSQSGPRIGPVVISEIMFQPPDVLTNGAAWNNTEDEYVELHNLSGSTVPLYDPVAPTNAWRLQDAVRFTFPTNQSVAAGERILVVPFDPTDTAAATAFRSHYNISPAVRLFGPFNGNLNNSGESVELTQPDMVRFYATNEIITAVQVDRVRYRAAYPWPGGAAGFGFALQRLNESAFGDEPSNWTAASPTPGQTYTPASRPAIILQPSSQTGNLGTDLTLTVQASHAGALSYQWRLNEANLPGATQPSLALSNLQPSQAGRYDVIVYSSSESTTSQAANITVTVPPAIQEQPQSLTIDPGENATFTVLASSATPMAFEWRRNGVSLPDENLPSLMLPGSLPPLSGSYQLVIRTLSGSVTSSPAILTVGAPSALITQHPVNQRAPLHGLASFGVALTNAATTPVTYVWHKNGTPILTNITDHLADFLTLPDLANTSAGTYSVLVANSQTAGELSATATLTLVADTDNDGIPDEYETAHGLQAGNAADAALDSDGDGATNREEYLAGTNPQSSLSVLKLESRFNPPTSLVLQFTGAANRSYTVQVRTALNDGNWTTLTSFPATSAETDVYRTLEAAPPEGPTDESYFRIVCPAEE